MKVYVPFISRHIRSTTMLGQLHFTTDILIERVNNVMAPYACTEDNIVLRLIEPVRELHFHDSYDIVV